jgi:uncharacterized membrane protein
MNKNRLEAFSDGVFAIAITLLILDIRIPKVDYDHLQGAIIGIMPKIASYMYSFLIIGVYWVSHHSISRRMAKIDRVVIWLNIGLLLFVGFIPFPTSLMGEYPFQRFPIVLYGCTLLVCNLIGFITWWYVSKDYRLLDPNVPPSEVRSINRSFLFVNLFYVVAIGIAFVHVYFSYAIFFSVIVFMIFFRRDENMGKKHKAVKTFKLSNEKSAPPEG